MNAPGHSLSRRLVAEGVGTAFLLMAVVGGGIAAQRLSPDDVGLQLFEAAVVTAFADQFEASVTEGGSEPEAAEQADASSSMVDSDRTLPEEEIDRPKLDDNA